MSAASIYDSLPLRKDQLSTRILTLLPGSHDDDIQCRLRVISINAFSDYEALSYTWGDPNDQREIRVNNTPLMVTRNLEEALPQLRHPTEKRYLWADAVCINQNDIDERGDQVSEMGQIYRNASWVLIWLGPERDSRFRENPFFEE